MKRVDPAHLYTAAVAKQPAAGTLVQSAQDYRRPVPAHMFHPVVGWKRLVLLSQVTYRSLTQQATGFAK